MTWRLARSQNKVPRPPVAYPESIRALTLSSVKKSAVRVAPRMLSAGLVTGKASRLVDLLYLCALRVLSMT